MEEGSIKYRNQFIIICCLGLIAVVFGAFSAHGLEGKLENSSLKAFNTAVQFHFYHVLVAMIACFAPEGFRHNLVKLAINFFIIGIFLFSGTIYLLSTASVVHQMDVSFLGPLTPIGGTILISAWFVLIVSAIPQKK